MTSPLQNRVKPDGEIVRHQARGTLMGNRGGRLHDPATRELAKRRWSSRAWICCEMDFRGRQRQVMGESYTELFFLDEVTALAAGHRPCFECRRQDSLRFARLFGQHVLEKDGRASAGEMDRILHDERLDGRAKRRHQAIATTLPDGTLIEQAGQVYAVACNTLLPWYMDGYGDAEPFRQCGSVTVLTPPSVMGVLAKGYQPRWHPTASERLAVLGRSL
ncbi:hypothetical protein [Coralliovum pocilloporae]|uniref:hypothetical protein n=1 Tax=Coralliovum pocilloporae TaxID=3066369 RepID=UPI00330796BF